MKLGIVTYMIAAEWDLDTIIKKCEELGYKGVELRTGHKVESNLTKKERENVRKSLKIQMLNLLVLEHVLNFTVLIKMN
jgi:sugar phosphate isomerase/epimerase